jgi:Nuclease-related domain
MLHDRRMPDSRANIDHIVLVPSGVWVIDSKRMKGRIKVEDAKDGTQKLLIKGRNQTELVHKLTWQLNAVKAAMAQIDSHVPVHGGFCFWLAIENTRDLFNPRVEDNGLPLLRTLTINGYPLFHPRQMTRTLNSAGTLSLRRAEELAATLAERFPAASADTRQSPSTTLVTPPPPAPAPPGPAATVPVPTPDTAPARLSKDEFRAAKQAEHQQAWE